ncbi:DinB family protein [Williamsia sterculiae]|uniref:Uncharacterized damage-inducible protein DinB (Forms a four-helix bundle) n=1 Tax=Williamsia sterculiae TaxID=1344003 RepID=A0A1N7H659_9NOCA|nr:DinB family protein [Williamsia sterculiae]SIS20346.1 Uncharacterized damage-inducible protein DinB (forms a four-helix bundle) [Williamsia sterculiae]
MTADLTVTDTLPTAGERESLLQFLARQRDLVCWKVAGCSDDAAHRTSMPSGLTMVGLVNHLTDVERSWFREVFAGAEDLDYGWSEEDPDAEFRVDPSVSVDELITAYRTETALCDAAIAGRGLDEMAVTRPMSLRWIIQHMIEETARHLGHLDLLRELADGQVGQEPDTR